MFFRTKRCQYCKIEIDKGKEISENVRVYGRSDTPMKHFCSGKHLDAYKENVDARLGNRKPRICTSCLR